MEISLMKPTQSLLGIAAVLYLASCGAAGAAEPSEAQMKDAMLYAMNHPPGDPVGAAITIKFFKKEACDNPTPQGYNCTFDVKVESTNLGASMYNNIPGGVFYVDKSTGHWNMRPPF
jgi:hypothetical protein